MMLALSIKPLQCGEIILGIHGCTYNGIDEVVKRVKRGCPQGSIGWPTLWNPCMNILLNKLCEMRVGVVAFADDLLLLIEEESRCPVARRASEVMKVVYRWGGRVGVDVSESKTVCMVLKGVWTC